MSGISILHNVPIVTLRPGPVLVIGKTPEGLTTGSMDFTCRKGDLSSPLVLSKLLKGSPIIDLYPQIGSKFTYLSVDTWTSRDSPGAFSTVSVEFKGVDATGEDSDASIVYTRTNSMVEESIFNSPRFIADVADSDKRSMIRQGSENIVYRPVSDQLERVADNAAVGSLDTDAERFWWDWIVEKKNLTYERASSEWTKTATARGQLPASQFADFGWIDTPSGSPSAPPGQTWRYMGSTESITVTGSGVNSYSQTWLSGDWPTEVYQKP